MLPIRSGQTEVLPTVTSARGDSSTPAAASTDAALSPEAAAAREQLTTGFTPGSSAAATNLAAAAEPVSTPAPFIGDKLFGQMKEIPQLAEQLQGSADEIKPVSVKLDGATKPWHKFGIFFEAEAKMKFDVPPEQLEPAADKLRQALRAAPEQGVSAILPPELAEKYKGYSIVVDKPENDGVTPFSDIYIDDANLTLNRQEGGIRVRRIGGDTDGKFEAKIPGDWIQGSEVLGRLEVVRHLMGKTWQEVVSEYKADPTNTENPLTHLKAIVPEIDIDSLAVKTDQVAQREQYVMKSPDGEDAFLITLDKPRAERVETGNVGEFYEVEIERMDGSIKEANVQELMDLTSGVARQFNLTRSGGTKYNEGMRVTE